MKKLFTIGALSVMSIAPIFAQKGKVNSAEFNLTSGEVAKAKENIDASFSSEEVLAMPKAWIVKGNVYKTIYELRDIHKDLYSSTPKTLDVAKEAYLKAFEVEVNPKKKGSMKDGLQSVGSYYYNEGITAFSASNWNLAYEKFKNTLEISEFLYNNQLTSVVDTQAYFVVLLSAFNTQNFDDAIKAGEKLAELKDNRDVVYTVLIDSYKQKNDQAKYEKAIADGRKAHPNNIDILYKEINLYLEKNELDKLEEKLDQALQLDPKNPSLYQAKASVYDKKGNSEMALQMYDKAIELNPEFFDAYVNKASFYNNEANKIIELMNNETNNAKYEKLKAERDDIFKNKMIPLLVKANKIDPANENVKKVLKEIYARLDMFDEMKQLDK